MLFPLWLDKIVVAAQQWLGRSASGRPLSQRIHHRGMRPVVLRDSHRDIMGRLFCGQTHGGTGSIAPSLQGQRLAGTRFAAQGLLVGTRPVKQSEADAAPGQGRLAVPSPLKVDASRLRTKSGRR
jgi:hypothetical protein